MSNQDRDFITRSESKKRSNKTQGRRNLDRLLNVLIAIVAVLIIINLYFVFSNNGEKAQDENEVETTQSTNDVVENNEQDVQNQSNSSEQETDSTSNADPEDNSNNESNEIITDNEPNNEDSTTNDDNNEETNESENTITTKGGSVIVQDSDDPFVEQIIIDPSWQVTPTAQSGGHVSTYQEGHIDYEEKKLTFRNAVGLDEDNIIFGVLKIMVAVKLQSQLFLQWINSKNIV